MKAISKFFVHFIFLSFFVFSMLHSIPGDPLEIECFSDPFCTTENLQSNLSEQGKDAPFILQYWNWLKKIGEGNLGFSRSYHAEVLELIKPRFFNSFLLAFFCILLTSLISFPLAIWTSYKGSSFLKKSTRFLSQLSLSLPIFWLALLAIAFFSIYLKWLPPGGTSPVETEASFLSRIPYLILPSVCLAFVQFAEFFAHIENAYTKSFQSEFIQAAHARGIHPLKIIFVHATKSAALPIVALFSIQLPQLLSGSLIIESIFSYDGLGKLLYDAIISNDTSLAMMTFLISAGIIHLFSSLSELLYPFLDPRIQKKASQNT